MTIVERVIQRFSKEQPNRKPIEVQKGYHVSPSAFAKKMLEKGITPKSKGNLGGEFARDKTYFFRDLSSAVESALDRLREAGKPLTFNTRDVLELQHSILEFDLKGMPTYADPEMPDEAGFTTKKIPSEAVKLVDFKEWEPTIARYGKKYKMPVKLPGDKQEDKSGDKPKEEKSEKPKEDPKSEKPKESLSKPKPKDPESKPAPKPKAPEKPKPADKPTPQGDSWKSFLDEVGDQKVPNPNPDSRDRFPKVKVRSLDPDKQREYYDKWKS